ncbi:MAG TPA: YcxB family protein [Clostridia bacterium]|nr:YcxB family protein [Clostridia bacterium]
MPTFYEGNPIETVEQIISEQDYADAYYAAHSSSALLHRRDVQAGICLSLAVLCASVIPLYRARFSTFWGPVCGILAFLALAAVFFFLKPQDTKNWARRLYRSNALMALPQKVTVYRDSIVLENGRERFSEYWTDFSGCVETKDAFILTGGRERLLLLIKKKGLSPERQNMLSAHFADAFAYRFRKFGRQGGT